MFAQNNQRAKIWRLASTEKNANTELVSIKLSFF